MLFVAQQWMPNIVWQDLAHFLVILMNNKINWSISVISIKSLLKYVACVNSSFHTFVYIEHLTIVWT